MTKTQVAQQLAIVAAAYPGRVEVTEFMVNIWFEAFADLGAGTFAAAIKTHVMVNKWPPTVADINLEVCKPDYPTALEAWGEVRKKIGSVGYYRSPTFSHPMIEAMVASLGWQTLCDMTNTDATRAHFMKLYESQCQRGIQTALRSSTRPEIEKGDMESIGEIVATQG